MALSGILRQPSPPLTSIPCTSHPSLFWTYRGPLPQIPFLDHAWYLATPQGLPEQVKHKKKIRSCRSFQSDLKILYNTLESVIIMCLQSYEVY